ncbi:MAG: FAD-binding protein [Nitrospirae bacterium]|nr:FAD-binding protein [Nitrospirota bacterium]
MERVRTDVVVVGGGAAGLRAAVAARDEGAEVLVVDSGHAGYTGSSFYFLNRAWGYQAVLPADPPRCAEALLEEILGVGGPETDAARADVLVAEAWPRLEELIGWGARLRTHAGEPVRLRGCFGRLSQAVCVEEFRPVFRALARALPVHNRWTALGLWMHDGQCVGVVGSSARGEMEAVQAGSVVLATGGAAGLYARTLADPRCRGVGHAMAEEAGARLKHLEFAQWILATRGRRRPVFFPVDLIARGEATLDPALQAALDRWIPPGHDLDRLFSDRARHFPFSMRDASGYLDVAVASLPVATVHLNHGRNESVEIFHAVHAFNGGIETDEWGRTGIDGLYAAGEAAGGIQAVDRLGGTMIPACLVFGKRAGESAARHARRAGTRAPLPPRLNDWHEHHPHEGSTRGAVAELQQVVGSAAGLVRTRSGLDVGVHRVRAWLEALSAGSSAARVSRATRRELELCGRAALSIMHAALARDRTCGSHFRADEAHRN